jgi:hypothetical protein
MQLLQVLVLRRLDSMAKSCGCDARGELEPRIRDMIWRMKTGEPRRLGSSATLLGGLPRFVPGDSPIGAW